jgi:hypothetical protein
MREINAASLNEIETKVLVFNLATSMDSGKID